MSSKRKHHQHHHQHHQQVKQQQQQIQQQQQHVVAAAVAAATAAAEAAAKLSHVKRQFPECAIEALKLIGSSVLSSSSTRADLTRLAHECIFLDEFDAERNVWTRKKPTATTTATTSTNTESTRSAMQELQGVFFDPKS